MITEIRLRGFKSFRDATLPLAPGITVLVGANNSGKSNAFAALRLLRETARQHNLYRAAQAFGGLRLLLARNAEQFEIGLTTDIGGKKVTYRFHQSLGSQAASGSEEELRVDDPSNPIKVQSNRTANKWDVQGTWQGPLPDFEPGGLIGMGRHPDSAPLVRGFSSEVVSMTIVDLAVPALRAESSVDENATLGSDGLNLAAVVDMLANTQPAVMKRVLKEVRSPVTDIREILTPPGTRPGTKVIGIEEDDGTVYRANEISDGLLLFIGLSVAAQTAGGSGLLAIEEPERGIHPRRIKDIVDQLRRIANAGTQVVVTTHSPLLLDEFRDTPECILVFNRDADGTHVERLVDHPAWTEDLARDQPLGDIWYSGILGGVPK